MYNNIIYINFNMIEPSSRFTKGCARILVCFKKVKNID